MAVTTTKTNKPINPRGNDQSPKGYNRAELYTGKALDFDGVNDYVEVADDSSLDFTTAMSAFCYARVDSVSQSNNTFFAKYDYGANQRSWIILQTNDVFRVIISKNGLTSSPNIKDYQFSTFENTSDYYFIGFTFESNVLKLYVNGQEVEPNKVSDNEVNAIHSGTAKASLGCNFASGVAASFLDGKVANARAFNVALTAAQVADLYNNPEKVVPTGVDNTALKLWLPMQEGAGTTAYDGSGNGNHGTISGATWTHGIGAPVAQTAVIDWNKQSYFAGNGGDDTYFTTAFADFNGQTAVTMYAEFVWQGITGNQNILDWGGNNGLRVRIETNNDYFQVLQKGGTNALTSSTAAIENEFQRIAVRADSNGLKLFLNGSEIGSNSTAIDSTASSTGFYIGRFEGSAAEYFNGIIPEAKVWTSSLTDAQLESLTAGTTNPEDYTSGAVAHWTGASEYEDQVGSYDLTAIGSPVRFLAPQGLTGGRDIFNALFENVRKQGALNLDGNSWAEVHDNASLDITDAITLEAWVKWEDTRDQTGIMGRWGANSAIDRNYMLYVENSTNVRLYINTAFLEYTSMTTGWRHIVGTYDKANMRLYVDGTQVAVAAQTSDITTSAKVLEIGRYRYATDVDKEYTNDIAQPRIYNRALTAEEVERNYNAGKNIYK